MTTVECSSMLVDPPGPFERPEVIEDFIRELWSVTNHDQRRSLMLQAVKHLASSRELWKRYLPCGVVVHAITGSVTIGGGDQLSGQLVVELPDGSMHRITGAEMSDWNYALAPFVKSWRLPEE